MTYDKSQSKYMFKEDETMKKVGSECYKYFIDNFS